MCVLFILYKDVAEKSLIRSAQICLHSLVPSLFPFMIAADLLCRANNTSILPKLLLGWTLGFPICAKAGAESYAEGRISYPVFRMMVCCGSIPSLPFTVGVCGDMFGKGNGIVLYIIVLSSALLCIPKFHIEEEYNSPKKITNVLNLSFGEELSSSISTCTLRMLSICGYVCFFSLLCDVLSEGLKISLFKCILGGILEFSGGVIRCKELGIVGLIPCAAILSFSGLSVYMQILSVERAAGCSSGGNDYIKSKITQAIISSITATGYVFRENILGKTILFLTSSILAYQFFRILQLIYRKRLKRIKSNNIIRVN